MNKQHSQKNKGFALLLSLIISSVVLSIGLSMLHITIKQLTLGQTALSSEIAFQAARAGIECLRHSALINHTDFIINGGSVAIQCLGQTSTMSDSDSSNNTQRFIHYFDWINSESTQCIQLEVYVVDASGGTSDVVLYLPSYRTPNTRTCPAGDICATAFVRGYNTSCADVSGNISAVQREISIEF